MGYWDLMGYLMGYIMGKCGISCGIWKWMWVKMEDHFLGTTDGNV